MNSHIPFAAEVTTAITAALELAMNQALKLDPGSGEKLAGFEGKIIAIELRNLDLSLYLLPGRDGITLMSHFEGRVDTTLSGTPINLGAMAMGQDANDTLFSGDVTIEGDVELGQRFKRFLDELDIDWEEHLSRLTGDIAAHKIGDVVRATRDWGRKALDILGKNAAEYLQQESQELPTQAAVREFIDNIDVLRDDVERLAARVQRLKQRLIDTKQN